jgi:hypothetical protein
MGIEQVSPRDVQEQVRQSKKRFKNFRNARLMFLRAYVGQYYDQSHGKVGSESFNLIHNAIRQLLPNIAMNFPRFTVTSNFLASRQYGEMLGQALDFDSKQQDLRQIIRVGIVDALFTLGILKTGLQESDSVQRFDEVTALDTGKVFTENVDFDNFVVDPASREHLFKDARWMGDTIIVPRQGLLESGLYNNELIEQLPPVNEANNAAREANDLSRRSLNGTDTDLMDEVAITELWVPGANMLLTVPGGKDVAFDEYLRTDDYYGPNTGPYTLLSMNPPVPGNPLPVPTVGLWYDLHVKANEMVEKIIDQATSQKDVVAYKPTSADDAEAFKDAADGGSVATDDPDGVQVKSFGGQQPSNEAALGSLQNWFNMIASNPQALAGERIDAGSATEARILQGNANIGLEDAKDMVYQWVADEARKRAWYLHTDPFIEVPLISRQQIPAQFASGPNGPVMMEPGRFEDVQIMLTSEARQGSWLDFTFEVEADSMSRPDRQQRFAEALDFAVKILPSATQSALAMFNMGIPFNAKEFIVRMAKIRGIEWMDEVFFDPDFQFRMQQMMMAGPSPVGSQGSPQQGQPQQESPLLGILQNGQAQVQKTQNQQQQQNQDAQAGAIAGQQQLRTEGFG